MFDLLFPKKYKNKTLNTQNWPPSIFKKSIHILNNREFTAGVNSSHYQTYTIYRQFTAGVNSSHYQTYTIYREFTAGVNSSHYQTYTISNIHE